MDVGLVFGIIFAAIVIGLLVFFGFKYINEMISISCESQTQQQIENLKNVIKSTLALSRDAVQEFKIIIQSNCAPKICFVNPDDSGAYAEGGWVPNDFLTTMVSSYKYNVVIIKANGAIDGYKIEKFKPLVNFCITSTRDVMFRNSGKMVEITLPEFE